MPDSRGSPSLAAELQRQAALRHRAAARLPVDAATAEAAANGAEALGVLHALASSPTTAEQALALLHELQVHQVELDLQAQELRDSRDALEDALRRQGERHDHLPVGCLTLDAQWRVQDLNATAARQLGLPRDDAVGLPFAGFVGGDAALRLRAAASRARAGLPGPACRVLLRPRRGPDRACTALLAADPAGDGHLVALADTPDETQPA